MALIETLWRGKRKFGNVMEMKVYDNDDDDNDVGVKIQSRQTNEPLTNNNEQEYNQGLTL